MDAIQVWETTQGNTKKELEFQVLDSDGEPENIAGYAITLKIGKPTPVTKNHAVVDVSLGKGKFVFEDSDVDTAGRFRSQIVIVDTTGKKDPWTKFQIYVEEAV